MNILRRDSRPLPLLPSVHNFIYNHLFAMTVFTVFLWILASWFFSVAGAVTENDGKIAYSHSGGGSPICSDERKRDMLLP
jgi:hypothetical protein